MFVREARASVGVGVSGQPARVLVAARKATATNRRLARAFARLGYTSRVVAPERLTEVADDDVVLGRLDVRPTLDGAESGLDLLGRVRARGAQLLNGPTPLLLAHDKLATALVLAGAGVPHPATVHVHDARLPLPLDLPCVIKPRFGSWGQDVIRCTTRRELRRALALLAARPWFGRHGAIAQEYVPGCAVDLRAVVAGRAVVGGIERIARDGEWRTNVALGAVRRSVELPGEAALLALRATAALGIDLAGVDLLRGREGELVVLEVNGAVDFTADYLVGGDVFDAAVGALLPPGPRAAPGAELALERLVEASATPDAVAPRPL